MRKPQGTLKSKLVSVAYFLTAWNILGFYLYSRIKSNKLKTDHEWDKKSASKKYLSLMGTPEDKIKVITVKGLSGRVEKKEMTLGEFLVPQPPEPPTKPQNSDKQ